MYYVRLGRCILLYLLFSEVRAEYSFVLREVRAVYSIVFIIFRG